MHTIDLAFAGHGIHEELVAYVADQEGYYEDENVHVAIRDGVHWPTERLRRGATIGLGRSLLSRMTDDIGWTAPDDTLSGAQGRRSCGSFEAGEGRPGRGSERARLPVQG